MPLQQREANVVWTGDLVKGNGTIKAGSGAIPELPVTFAARTEASGGKTSPEELLAAAHASCFAMALSNTLAKGGNPPQRLEIKATCSLDRVEGGLKITTMQLDVVGEVKGMQQAQFEAAARDAGQNCPVSKALHGNLDIRVQACLR